MKIFSYFERAPMTNLGVGIFLSLTAFSCFKLPNDPILPASDIQMSVPILDRMNTVSDMMTKDTSKVRQNGAGYYYEDDRTFSPTGIDSIKVSPQPSANQVGIGQLTVPGLLPQNSSVAANQLFTGPFPIVWPSPPLPGIPASNTTIPGVSMQDTTDFDFLRISSGTMTVSVTNTLPMDIAFTKPLILRNHKLTTPVDTSIIASFSIGTVLTGQTKPVASNLSGVLMRGTLQTDSISISTATKQGPFTINSTDGISFGFGTTALVVDSAAAKIPQQSLFSVNDSLITLDPTAVLQQALFSKGQFSLNINNQTGLSVGARMKFSNFVRSIAPFDTLTIDTTLAGHTGFGLNVSLANYRVVNGSPNGPGTSLKFSIGIRTVNSGGNKATVTFKDFVNASFVPQQQFVLKSLTGIMNPMTVPVNTGVGLSGLGSANNKFSGSFSYDSIQIQLKFALSSGYPIQHALKLYSINRKVIPNKFDSLTIPAGTIQPGLNTPGVITLGNAQGLSAFLGSATSSLPDSLYVKGQVVINPPVPVSGTIFDTTKIYPSISTYIPMKLGLVGGTYTDVSSIKGQFDSSFVTDVKSGAIYFSITNGLPLTLSFRASFMKWNTVTHRSDTLLTIPLQGGGSVNTISGGNVDAGGSVATPNISSFNMSLVTAQILQLAATDSVAVFLSLSTSGNTTPTVQAVRIRATDYIRVRASANMVYTVNKKK